jgi:hypothetical protein
MKHVAVRLVNKVSYLNVILTLIVVLLGVHLAIKVAFVGTTDAHAFSANQAQIEAVSRHIVGDGKAEDAGKHRLTREQATELIVAAKKTKGLTWEQIAKEVGGH